MDNSVSEKIEVDVIALAYVGYLNGQIDAQLQGGHRIDPRKIMSLWLCIDQVSIRNGWESGSPIVAPTVEKMLKLEELFRTQNNGRHYI